MQKSLRKLKFPERSLVARIMHFVTNLPLHYAEPSMILLGMSISMEKSNFQQGSDFLASQIAPFPAASSQVHELFQKFQICKTRDEYSQSSGWPTFAIPASSFIYWTTHWYDNTRGEAGVCKTFYSQIYVATLLKWSRRTVLRTPSFKST